MGRKMNREKRDNQKNGQREKPCGTFLVQRGFWKRKAKFLKVQEDR